MTLAARNEQSERLHDDQDFYLIRAVAAGDDHALEVLYRLHGPALHSYLLSLIRDRQLIEEVLQDTLLAVWRGAWRFQGRSSVRTWLFAITRRRAMSALRKVKRPDLQLFDGNQLPDYSDGPLELLLGAERQERMQAALLGLPLHQREVVQLVVFHGLTGREAAKVLRVAPGTIKSRLHRALQALRKDLEGERM